MSRFRRAFWLILPMALAGRLAAEPARPAELPQEALQVLASHSPAGLPPTPEALAIARTAAAAELRAAASLALPSLPAEATREQASRRAETLDRLQRLAPYFLSPDEARSIARAQDESSRSLAEARTADTEAELRRLRLALDPARPRPSEPPVGPDLAPTSDPLELTPQRQETLRRLLVGDNRPLSEAGFRAYALSDPAAYEGVARFYREQPKLLEARPAENLYRALRAVIDSELPADERAALALSVSRRFAAVLERVIGDVPAPAYLRERMRRYQRRLADGTIIYGLLLSRRVVALADRLQSLLAPFQGASPSKPNGGSPQPWKIAAPAKNRVRPAPDGAPQPKVNEIDLRAFARSVESWMEQLSRRLRRQALISEKARSSRGVDRESASLAAFIAKAGAAAGQARLQALRTEEVSITKWLYRGKGHAVSWVPDHPALSLIPEPGGFLLTARMKTDIADPKVAEAVKAAIEREWAGTFTLSGRPYAFRTSVTIEPLAPGEKAGGDAILLTEATGSTSFAKRGSIHLLRSFTPETAAHEFGHLLGLADTYWEQFDFDALKPKTITPDMADLMANTHGAAGAGVVLPRHLKTAVLLLRRKRLAPAAGR